MKIGILGGTFNPVHKGHISLANQLIEQNFADKILFVVSARPPHKNESMPSAALRYEMVQIALCDQDGLEPCDIELKRQGKSYTADTMPYLRQLYPTDSLFFITGADMFIDIPNWHLPEVLFQNEHFIVADRSHAFHNSIYLAKKNAIMEKYRPNVQFAEIDTPDISSSQIRSNIEAYKAFLPEKVYAFIKRNGLYE